MPDPRAAGAAATGRKKLRKTKRKARELSGNFGNVIPNEYEDSKSAEHRRAEWLQRQRPPHWQ